MKMKIAFSALAFVAGCGSALGFGFYGGSGLSGGYRWDAAPRQMGGLDRSLSGGLTYSVLGGSYSAFKNVFTWSGAAPTDAAFQQAVERAFSAWTVVDPASGLGTTVSFRPDFGTAVSTSVVSGVRQGAMIDLFGASSGSTFSNGDPGLRAEAFFSAVAGTVTLTSGTANYNAAPISGADVTLNSNTNALWTLPWFETILRHEIGHTLGLADVDLQSGPGGTFVDDNYNPNNAAATLSNSFAGMVNIANPAASAGLSTYSIPTSVFAQSGVDIMMESNISSFFLTNSLQNDDFAGRQFLYPTAVPEPATMTVLALAGLAALRRRKRS